MPIPPAAAGGWFRPHLETQSNFSKIPPAEAGGSFKSNLRFVISSLRSQAGRALTIHQLPLVGFPFIAACVDRLGFNNPPASAGGIRLFVLLSARPEKIDQIGDLLSKSTPKFSET